MSLARRKSRVLDLRGIGLPMVSVKEESGSMFSHRRTPAIAAAIAALSLVLSSALVAAPVKGRSPSKIVPPKQFLTGSAVTKGRSFCRPTMREDALGGIRLGREAKEVLSRWGNPTSIVLGGSGDDAAPAGPPPGGPAYTPPAGGDAYAGLAAGVNQAASILGMQTPPMSRGGGLPSLPGYPAPGTAPLPSAAPAAGGSASLSQDEVIWSYDLSGGITLEFVITDGLVTQITVGGQGPWGLSKTRTGLQLGDTYKLALYVCGYPESQKYVGRFLRVSYVNQNRVVYTFLNKKLVGVTIALVPQDMSF